MGDKTDILEGLLSKEQWADIAAVDYSEFLSSWTRMTFDKGTDNRLGSAKLKTASSSSLPSAQAIEGERREFELAFKNSLAEAGISEQEYHVLVDYVREYLHSHKSLPSESNLEQRILADRPQRPRFPGTVDVKGYTIGLAPRMTQAAEFALTGAGEFAKAVGSAIKLIFTDPALAFSLMLDFLPVIGDIKGMIEAATGEDLITGEKLPDWVRALSFGLSVHGCAKASWKLAKVTVKTAKVGSKVAAKAIAPIVLFAAITGKAPVETMRFIKNAAAVDETALKVALKDAENVKDVVLTTTKANNKAIENLSLLLSPDEIAAARKTAQQTIDKAATTGSGKSVPVTPVDAPGLPTGSGGGRSGRKPKLKPKPKVPPPTLRFPQSSVAKLAAREGGLTAAANKIKGLGQGRGATVEIALATTKDGEQILVAGINSGSRGLNPAQLKQLEEWGVNVAPEMAKGMKRAPHAEENIAAFLDSIGAVGVRWSKGVVGAGGSYICKVCQAMVERVGGRIEKGLSGGP